MNELLTHLFSFGPDFPLIPSNLLPLRRYLPELRLINSSFVNLRRTNSDQCTQTSMNKRDIECSIEFRTRPPFLDHRLMCLGKLERQWRCTTVALLCMQRRCRMQLVYRSSWTMCVEEFLWFTGQV